MALPSKMDMNIEETCPIETSDLAHLILLPPRQQILLLPLPPQLLLAPLPKLLLLSTPRTVDMLAPPQTSIGATTGTVQMTLSINFDISKTVSALDQITLHPPANEPRSVGKGEEPKPANGESPASPASRTQPETTKCTPKNQSRRGCTHPRRVRPQRWTSVEQSLGDSDRIVLGILQQRLTDRLAADRCGDNPNPLPANQIQIGPAELRNSVIGCKKTAQRCLKRLVKQGFLERISRNFVGEGDATIYRLIPLESVASAMLQSGLTHYVNRGNGGRAAVPAPDDGFPDTLDDSGEMD
jgi:hypothetical protein